MIISQLGYNSLIFGLLTSIFIFFNSSIQLKKNNLVISDKRLISLGDLKYTTLSFKTLRTVKVVSAINVRNAMINTNLNLTFLLYINLN